MNGVCIKVKGKSEMIFPQCYYQQQNNFVLVETIDGSHEIGAFNVNIIEYVYLDYKETKRDKRGWYNEIRRGIILKE